MQRIDRLPRISVIIPTYNRADFIGETIQSVLNQTYADFELIVLDDASTDETAQVVAQFDDERVTYIYQEDNVGETAARNAGFAYARGELVSFLDSDDRMLPHNLETLVAVLDARPEVSVAYGWYYLMDKDGRPIMMEYAKIEGQIPPQIDSPWPGVALRPSGLTLEGQVLPQLVLEVLMLIGSTLIRRACVEAIGGFDETLRVQGHWDFYLRLARAGYAYACSKQAVLLWRIHPGSRGRDSEAMLANRLAILDRLFNDPALEATLGGVRHQAYYSAYIDYALAYYGRGDFEQGARYLNEALRYAPLRFTHLVDLSEMMTRYALASDDKDPFEFARDLFKPIRLTAEVRRLRGKVLVDLSETMISYALAPGVKDPLQFARDLFKPIRLTVEVRRLRGKVLGQINAELAFRHYQAEELSQVWRHALGAVIHDPSWLRNRGLARIALEGLLGSDIVDRIRPRRFPVSNKVLETVSETTSIFISPHFDDAVLSCGGTLAHLARRGADILLVTVFTADLAEGTQLPPLAHEFHKETGEDKYPHRMRGLEEQEVVEHLDAKYHWLDFLDGMYRYPEMRGWEEQFMPDFEPRTDACFESVRDALLQVISEHPGATVFAPLGLGHHRDHLIVHQALEDIREMTSTANSYYYYEDYPYAATANLQARLDQLDWPDEAFTIDIGDTLEERVRLIKMYASQSSMLFGDTERIYEDVESYATRVGTRDKPQERFWSPRAGN